MLEKIFYIKRSRLKIEHKRSKMEGIDIIGAHLVHVPGWMDGWMCGWVGVWMGGWNLKPF
jgi:hypothetical protein